MLHTVGQKGVPLDRYQAYFFDLDGTVYFGGSLAPGALELVKLLKDGGKKVLFITNNSWQTAAEISARLGSMGLTVDAGDIITATENVGRYIKERYGCLRIAAAGSKALSASLEKAGHMAQRYDPRNDGGIQADAVVVGLDADFSYRKLAALSEAARQGAIIIAANADLSHPGNGGRRVPETGALVAAIEAVSGCRAEFVGKPQPYLFQYGLQRCAGVRPEDCVMIGDNYNTDIIGGRGAGLHTVWLRGGLASDRQDQTNDWPAADLIVEHLPELYPLIGGYPL